MYTVFIFSVMSVIVVNVKAYREGIGDNAVQLARIMQQVGEEFDINMIIAVQPCDIYRVSSQVDIDVFAQHVDCVEYGSYTGFQLPDAIKAAGATGTLINHSERRIKIDDIECSIQKAKWLGLKTIVCTSSVEITKAIACLNPDFVAIEPPELIGGDISVTTASPDIVKNAVDSAKNVNANVNVLCGAGIKNGGDVAMACELGTVGVLVASGIVKIAKKKEILEDMAKNLIP
jgi:triosephosphate isomerase